MAAAAAIGLMIPFEHAPALGTDREKDITLGGVEEVHGDDGHGRAIGEQLQMLLGDDAHEVVGRLLEALADLLQDSEGGGGFPANDIAEMPGRAAAPLRGLLIAQVFGVADL